MTCVTLRQTACFTLTTFESLSLAGNILSALPLQVFQNCSSLSSLTLSGIGLHLAP